jgi:hypothetical protein
MSLQQQIEGLRRRFQAGDHSAREALQQLLHTYLRVIVRRAARPENSDSRVADGIRRLAGAGGPLFDSVDELCRRLCDELLQAPVMAEQVQKVFETMRSAARSTALFGLRG